MDQISVEELYDLYVDTARRCSSGITSLSDEEIKYNLFEEFDSGVCSFFHEDSLQRLVEAGLIGKEAFSISQEIRSRWLAMGETRWTIDEIKRHPSWKQLFSSCDRLLAVLDQHE